MQGLVSNFDWLPLLNLKVRLPIFDSFFLTFGSFKQFFLKAELV